MDHKQKQKDDALSGTMQIPDSEWKKRLSHEQFYILRMKGTEAPFSGKFTNTTANGKYICAGCGTMLFHSSSKFHSSCGWPSFSTQTSEKNVGFREDHSHNMVRIEVFCKNCGGHLGHVFDDGPLPSGKRYCINSEALNFLPEN